MTAPASVMGERLVANRTLRVPGEGGQTVEVRFGEDVPRSAFLRPDVYIRIGYVVRFDESGRLDRRSWPYARNVCRLLGIPRERPAHVRASQRRASALEAGTIIVSGRRVRVLAGRPDGAEKELFVVGGRAFPIYRGAPDSLAAAGALRASVAGGGTAPRRRGRSNDKRRRRRRREA